MTPSQPQTPAAPSLPGPLPPPYVGRLVLLGHPVAHSLSPRFQNAALAATYASDDPAARAARARSLPDDRALRYEALDVPPDALAATVRALAAERAAGNVTVPHKEAFAALCDRLSSVAARVGAVNTFWTSPEGALVGDNTDVGGFARAVRALLGAEPLDLTIAVLGAGGAAAAALAAMERWPGCRVRVWSRTGPRADALAARFAPIARSERTVAGCVRGAALVVNATPLGLRVDDPLPVAPERLRRGSAVLDLVYHPEETAWVRRGRAAGLRASDGLTMLLEQGALAFERWFGVAPDRDRMWDALALPPWRHGAPPAPAPAPRSPPPPAELSR